MIGNDAMACRMGARWGLVRQLDRSGDQMAEQIDVEMSCTPCITVAKRSSPMPVSIDGRGSGSRRPPANCSYCMNTRFQISTKRSPSLVGGARQAAGELRSVIEENLRAGTAGAGIAHRPEIVRSGNADDFRLRKARNLLPEPEGLIVLPNRRWRSIAPQGARRPCGRVSQA